MHRLYLHYNYRLTEIRPDASFIALVQSVIVRAAVPYEPMQKSDRIPTSLDLRDQLVRVAG